MKITCDVYKSLTRENYYLYVPADEGLERVPEALRRQFGKLEKTLSFDMTDDRRLAKEDPKVVMANLAEQGYHLQLPPARDWHRG